MSVKAFCVMEIQVSCDSSWTDDTTMKQIVKQAEDDARHRLGKLFRDAGDNDADLSTKRQGSHGISLISVKRVISQIVSER